MNELTIVIPTSPIPSHPDTAILAETLDSVRHHLPAAEIIVMFDGVRTEQEDMRADYVEFTRQALWLLDKRYKPAVPILCGTHQHQTGMMRAALVEIRTDLLMFVEHDTPLTDGFIDWDGITDFVVGGGSHLVRFYHEAVLQPAHTHMQHGTEHGHYQRTSQWSQRPHVAATEFYRRIMDTCFTSGSKSFIEDKMHGVCDEAFKLGGMDGLDDYRLHIYTPDGDSIQRSSHSDGRAGGAKFDDSQTF